VDKLDFERLRKETDIVGYPILPLIRQLDAMCQGESGKYLVSCPPSRAPKWQLTAALGGHHAGRKP